MKRVIIGVVVFLFVATAAIVGFGYYEYQQREARIAKVLEFKDLAFRAYSNLANNNLKEAKKLYERALALHDEDSKTLRDFAQVLSKLGEHKRAVEIFERAYKLDLSKREDHLTTLADMHFKLENYEKAAEFYKEAIERFRPRYRHIEGLIASLLRLDRKDEVMGYYAFVVQNDPDFFEGKFPELRAKYTKETKAIDLTPRYDTTDEIDALLSIAREYRARGFDRRALLSYYKIINQEKTHDEANKEVADLLLKHSDTKRALVHLEHVKNKDFDVFFKIGGIHHQSKNYEKAIEYYRKALDIKETPMLLKNLVACGFHQRDIDKVEYYMAKLEKVDPRLANEIEHSMLIRAGFEMQKRDKILYQLNEMWFDFQDILKG